MIFCDIGSFDGQEIQWALDHGYEVHAFEPNPAMKEVLLKKFGDNPKVKLNFAAAWNKDGVMNLYLKPSNDNSDMGVSLIQDKTNVDKENFVEVPTINIGQYVKGLHENIDILKIDAEGAEYIILDSIFHNVQSQQLKNIYVEDHSALIYNWYDHKKKVLDYCRLNKIELKEWLGINFKKDEFL